MTRSEAIEFLQKFSKAFEKYPIHGDVRAPFHEAIALAVADMEAADKAEQWVEHPACPDCGTFLHDDFGEWTCLKCEKAWIVEEGYRVIGPDKLRNEYIEELRKLSELKPSEA